MGFLSEHAMESRANRERQRRKKVTKQHKPAPKSIIDLPVHVAKVPKVAPGQPISEHAMDSRDRRTKQVRKQRLSNADRRVAEDVGARYGVFIPPGLHHKQPKSKRIDPRSGEAWAAMVQAHSLVRGGERLLSTPKQRRALASAQSAKRQELAAAGELRPIRGAGGRNLEPYMPPNKLDAVPAPYRYDPVTQNLPGDEQRAHEALKLDKQEARGEISWQEYTRRKTKLAKEHTDAFRDLQRAGFVDVPSSGGWFGSQVELLGNVVKHTPGGLVHMAKKLAPDLEALATLPGTPGSVIRAAVEQDPSALYEPAGGPEALTFPGARDVAKEVGGGLWEDIKHPSILTALDALAVVSGGAGVASRVGALGKLAKAGELSGKAGVRRAAATLVSPAKAGHFFEQLTPEEYASEFGLKVKEVRKMVKEAQIPSTGKGKNLKIPTKRWYGPDPYRRVEGPPGSEFEGQVAHVPRSKNEAIAFLQDRLPVGEGKFLKARKEQNRVMQGQQMAHRDQMKALTDAVNEEELATQHLVNPAELTKIAANDPNRQLGQALLDHMMEDAKDPESVNYQIPPMKTMQAIQRRWRNDPEGAAKDLVDIINRGTVFAILHAVPIKYIATNMPGQFWLSITSGALNPYALGFTAKLYADLHHVEMSAKEYGQMLGISEQTVKDMVDMGHIGQKVRTRGKGGKFGGYKYTVDYDARGVLERSVGGGITKGMVERNEMAPLSVGGKVLRGEQAYAHVLSKILDEPFRFLNFAHYARKAGYHDLEDVKKLLVAQDPQTVAVRNTVIQNTNRSMIDYERLGHLEKAYARRMVLFYPWLKGSTYYFGRWFREHPIQANIQLQEGKLDVKRQKRELGPLPPWLQSAIKVGEENIPGLGTVPDIIDPTSASIVTQTPDLAEGLMNTIFKQKPTIGEHVSPIIGGALALGAGVDIQHGRQIQGGPTQRLAETSFGSSPIGQGIAAAHQAITGKSIETPRFLENHKTESIFPRSRGQNIARTFFGGGVFTPTPLNPKRQKEEYKRSVLEQLPPKGRETAKMEFAWQDYMSAAERTKYEWSHGEKVQLSKAFHNLEQRNINRIGKKGKDALLADLDTVVAESHAIKPDERQEWVDTIAVANESEMKTISKYFGQLLSQDLLSSYAKILGVKRAPQTRPSR